jgi:hypothetical protein
MTVFGVVIVAFRAGPRDRQTTDRGRQLMADIKCYVDGEEISFPVGMVVSHAARKAMTVLGRQGGLFLARESGDYLPATSSIDDVCQPGDRLTLVVSPEGA